MQRECVLLAVPDFNPHTREGCDAGTVRDGLNLNGFQSTHP